MNMMLALILAAVPLPWTVETSRVQPASFDAYHGEALEFVASFNTLGKPLALDSHTATLYYQTNGMDQAWWSVPASVSGNVARATFTPAMDPCAPKIVVFIGVSDGPSNLNYRAAANVRFLNSPGANPGWIDPPVVKLDFSQVETLNAPWFTKDESNGRFSTKTETGTKIASATNGLESAAHAAQTYQVKGRYLTSESDPTVDGKIEAHDESSAAHGDIRTALAGKQATIDDLASIRSGAALGATAVQPAAISDMETQTHAAANYAAKSSLQDKFDKSGGNMSGTLNLVDGSSLLFDGEDWTSVFDRIVSQYVWDWSSIYNTPTTLSGYGIEDAYIQNGTITLGSQSITPLTSYIETDPTVPTWAKTPSKPTYNWSEIGSKPTIPTDSTVSGWGYLKSESDPTVDAKLGTKLDRTAVDAVTTNKYAEFRQSANGMDIVPHWYDDGESYTPYWLSLGRTIHVTSGDNDVTAGIWANDDACGFGISASAEDFSDGCFDTFYGNGFIDIGDNEITIPSKTGELALITDVPNTPEDIGAAPASIANTVNAWQTYWDGDDVRVTVTNYYGSQDLPSLYLEQKISEGGTNYYKTIWTEKARLDVIINRIVQLEADINTKADRAWGFYDSHTGKYAPDGFTSISSGAILVSKDMSYQKTVTTGGGEVWVLTANDPTVITGTETNGFFRITDSEGNNVFEVVKGDKRVVPATTSAVAAGNNSLTITYNVVSQEHPSIEICDDLVEQDWKAEDDAGCPATVVWGGSSGAYVATVTGRQAMSKMFVKGTYEICGETYIRNGAPVAFEKVILGGVTYRVTVETVNNKKLMVLTEL